MLLRRVLVVVALLCVAACTDDRSSLPDQAGPTVAATLKAAFTRTQTALTWTYTLRNDELEAIAVFSGSEESSVSAGAWVVPRDDDTIEVSQRLFAQPANVGLARPHTQFGTILRPGASLSGSATVLLPLRVAHPYGFAFEPPLQLPSDADGMVFCVGMARAKDFPPAGDDAAPSDAGTANYVHAGGSRQHLACAPTQPAP